MDRLADRNRERVDRGYAFLRVDEQPLPVERDDLDLDGDGLEAANRHERIQGARAEPGDSAEKNDDEHRDRPDDQFEGARELPRAQ